MNRIKKLAPYGVGLLAIAGVLAAPQAAQAHDGGITATCTTLSADLSNYPAGSTIGGTLDGVDLGTSTFGPSFSQSTALDPAVPHAWSISVTSGDGDPRYSFTSAGTSDPACIPVVEEPPVAVPPVEPPVVVPPVEPPVEEPPVVVPPAPVVEPRVQDYITCLGGAFVLDNTGSTVDVVYTVNGFDFTVPAGTALHTDADGYLVQPNAVFDQYTVTAGDEVWTFASGGNCPIEQPDEPTTPVTPPVDEPTTPVEEPTEPSTPVETPAVPVVDETPAPAVVITPTDDETPAAVTAAEVPDGLAYTGTSPWLYVGGAGALAAIAGGILLRVRRRQVTTGGAE